MKSFNNNVNEPPTLAHSLKKNSKLKANKEQKVT